MKRKTAEGYCRCLYYSANALARVTTRLAEEAFARTGLAPSHAFVLMSVNSAPGMQPKELSRIMMLTPSTVTRLIEKLEAKGLVRRQSEGKLTRVYPTPAGKKLDRQVRSAWRSFCERYRAILGRDESERVTGAIYDAAVRLDKG